MKGVKSVKVFFWLVGCTLNLLFIIHKPYNCLFLFVISLTEYGKLIYISIFVFHLHDIILYGSPFHAKEQPPLFTLL